MKNFFKTHLKFKEKSGVSLLLGLGLVFAILFFGLIVGNVVVSSVRQSANVNRANEAYFAAEGALEEGLLANYEQGAGYTSDVNPVNVSGLDATYQIQGQVPEAIKYINNSVYQEMYGIPTPGTGNVGEKCDPLNPVVSGTGGFVYLGESFDGVDAADHPCNWNKFRPGDTVTIPLYYYAKDNEGLGCETAPSGGYICNPAKGGAFDLESLVIRIRTACKEGKIMCWDYQRATLNVNEGEVTVYGDDTIVDWQISGIGSDGRTVVIQPGRDFDTWLLRDTGWNSEIYESFINYPSEALHLESSVGVDTLGKISAPNALAYVYSLKKPLLKLTVIRSLSDDYGDSIPYLEYQVLTNASTSPPSNVEQTIKAEGISGTFKYVLEVNQPQAGGLPEYVVQQ